MASHGCDECGGVAGHTLACSHGPGPADAPTADDLYGAAAALEFPELEVVLPNRNRPVVVPGRRQAWIGFIGWVTRRPEAASAAFAALEAYERTWRAEAPTLAEVVG